MHSFHHRHRGEREARSRGEFGFHSRLRGFGGRHGRRGERIFDQGDLRT